MSLSLRYRGDDAAGERTCQTTNCKLPAAPGHTFCPRCQEEVEASDNRRRCLGKENDALCIAIICFVGLAVLILLAVLLSGCEVKDDLRPAFYMVQGNDVRGTGEDLSGYGLLVCNPNLKPEAVRVAAGPGAVLLGYVDIRWVPTWGAAEPVYLAMRAAFGPADYQWTETGEHVEIWPDSWELAYREETAIKLADFVATYYAKWDGIYLDDVHAYLWPERMDALGVPPDGRSIAQIEWARFRDVAVQQIAERLPTAKLVANVGPGTHTLTQLPLDGVCSEEHWPEDRQLFLETATTLFDPTLCVAWEWDGAGMIRSGEIRYR